MDIAKIAVQNPWWAKKEAIEEDIRIRQFLEAPVRWIPRISKHMPLDRNVIYSVRGPRQVGKTTLAKVTIRNLLLDTNSNPIDVMYYACDLIRSFEMLYDLLESYYEWNRKLSAERVRIFLDEISAIPDWQKAIKRFVDQYGNENITFYLTSSHSLDIERSTERLPGRSGEREGISTHKILLPMKFSEYVELRKPEIYEKAKALKLDDRDARSKELLMLGQGKMPDSANALLPLLPELDALFDEYLLTGGVMLAVSDFIRTKRISQTIYELYIRQLLGDISRVGREERTAKQVIASIVSRIGAPSSWNGIAKENGIPSSPTVSQYVNILQGMFILNVYHKADDKLRPKGASDKKIHITNPFIFHALRSWALNPVGDSFKAAVEFLTSTENKSKLIEGVIGDHLARAAFNFKPTDLFDVSSHIFYWKTKKGNEIDYILKNDDKPYAFDVTHQQQLASHDYRALRRFGKGCMISKSQIMTSQKTVTVPVSLFLLYI